MRRLLSPLVFSAAALQLVVAGGVAMVAADPSVNFLNTASASGKFELPQVHVSGTNFQIGLQIGTQMKERIHAALQYETEQLAWGATNAGRERYKQALAAHNKTYPHLVREMEGLAVGAGLPFEHIFVKNTDWAFIYLMHPWDGSGSLAGPTHRGPALHCTDYIADAPPLRGWGHNEDGDAWQKAQNFVVHAEVWREGETRQSARRFTAYTYAGMLSGWAFGANEHVAYSINALFPKPPAQQFLSIYAVTRDVLEATSIDDAVRRASVAGQAGGAAYNMGEFATQRQVNFETAPAAAAEQEGLRPRARSSVLEAGAQPHGVAAHANSYLRLTVPDAYEHYDSVVSKDSAQRVARAGALPPATSDAMVLDVLGDVEGLYPIYNAGTLATAFFDLEARTLRIWNGNAKGKAQSPDVTLQIGMNASSPPPRLHAGRTRVSNETLLRHVPMVMTHDAGSGYLGAGLVNRWTKTQSVGLAGQLACGARAFDARPMNTPTGLKWHHGGVAVPYLFSQTLKDMVAWCTANPAELVMLLLWDCEGDDCAAALTKALTAAGVPVVADCAELSALTYGGARARARLAGGGLLLAFTGGGGPNGAACADTSYDSSLTCSGTQGLKEYSCWADSKSKAYPVTRMLAYLDAQEKGGLPIGSHFQQWQALWEESAESVVLGTLKNSSLLLDEQYSQLNAQVAAGVRAGRYPHAGLLEVNNVCDGGNALLAALRASFF